MIKILIPTYNEAQNIEAILSAVRSILPEVDVLVIDDSSPDGTGDIVCSLAKDDRHIELLSRSRKEGLGKAYIDGFKNVLQVPKYSHLIMMDADFSHDPTYLPDLIKASDGQGMVIGSRYVAGGATEGWEGWRKKLSAGGNMYTRTITRMPIKDLTAGFNLISTEALRNIDLERIDSSGYAFQIELKYILWKSGAKITEMPIHFKQRREGESKLSGHIISEGLLAPWKLILRNL